MKRFLWIAVGVIVLAASLFGAYVAFEYTLIPSAREQLAAVDPNDPFAYGELMFETRGCIGCHRIREGIEGPTDGPNLAGITERSTVASIRESIEDPRAVIAEGCQPEPCHPALMPVYGEFLTPGQIDALVAYIVRATAP